MITLMKIKPNLVKIGTGKKIYHQIYIDKIYLYAKDPYEGKYQYLINKRELVVINHFNDPKAFIE